MTTLQITFELNGLNIASLAVPLLKTNELLLLIDKNLHDYFPNLITSIS